MLNAFITFTVLSKDPVAIKHSRGSSLCAEKQFPKVRSRNYMYLPFSSNGRDTQTDTTTAITLCPCFAGKGYYDSPSSSGICSGVVQ